MLKRRIATIIAWVFGALLLASCADWVNQGWQVRHARAQIAKRFPANVDITEARNTVIADYPRHIEYSTADCEKWFESFGA